MCTTIMVAIPLLYIYIYIGWDYSATDCRIIFCTTIPLYRASRRPNRYAPRRQIPTRCLSPPTQLPPPRDCNSPDRAGEHRRGRRRERTRSGHLRRAPPTPMNLLPRRRRQRGRHGNGAGAPDLVLLRDHQPPGDLRRELASVWNSSPRVGASISSPYLKSTAPAISSSARASILSVRAPRPSSCTPSTELPAPAPRRVRRRRSFLLPPLVPPPRICFLDPTRNCRFQRWHPNHGRNWSQ
jgi:hypothetical protein